MLLEFQRDTDYGLLRRDVALRLSRSACNNQTNILSSRHGQINHSNLYFFLHFTVLFCSHFFFEDLETYFTEGRGPLLLTYVDRKE
jgi:hypothetical protein